ncbi:MAG TPA: hypothetical protein VL463_22310 [Kofleriaceae bacterium]|nr:hypothetical protein [Kofleriaceae bacterium]
MKRLVLAVLLIGSLGSLVQADAASDLAGRMWSALRGGTDCAKTSATKSWCLAATGWSTAKVVALPKAKLMVGMTVQLVDGGVVVTELRDKVALSAVALGGDASKPTIAIHPIDFQSPDTAAKAIGAVRMVLAGKSKRAELPGGIDTVHSALDGQPTYELVKGDHGWSWSGASSGELRKIGALWVAYEPMTNGAYVTLLTDALK